jgi:hypothetical protein
MTWIEFTLNKERVNLARFPITEVGDSSVVTLEARNPTEDPIELTPNAIDDSALTLEQYPKRLEAGQSGPVVLRFNVPQDRRKPLETGILFREVMGE